MAFTLVHHHEEVLDELIGLCQRGVSIEPGRQIILLERLKSVLLTHKQKDGGVGRKLLDALRLDDGLYLGFLERLQVAIERPVRASVALLLDFPPEGQTISLSLLPAFEDIGSKGVKGTGPLAS